MVKKFLLRNIAMFLSLVMLITSTAQTTYGFISVASEPLVNTFVPVSEEKDSVNIRIKKNVNGNYAEGLAGFEFVIRDITGVAEGEQGKEIATISTDEYGYAEKNLEYNEGFLEEETEKTFRYSVSEVNTGIKYMGYDDSVKTFEVKVKKEADGSISATLIGDTYFEFVNTYEPETTVEAKTITVNFEKKMAGDDYPQDLSGFVFVITNNGAKVARAETNADGKATVTFDIKDAGEYHYTVVEEEGSNPNIEYSKDVHDFMLTATSDGNKISVDKDVFDFEFTNIYKKPSAPTTSVTIDISTDIRNNIYNTKLDGFEFYLTDMDGNIIPWDELISDVHGKESIVFTFTEPEEPGQVVYEFKICQDENPDKDDIGEGFIFDKYHTVKIIVTKDEEGKVSYTVSVDDKEVTEKPEVIFTNRYPGEVYAVLDVEKIIDNKSGAEIPENVDFTFHLTNKDSGELIDAVTITGKGKKPFEQLAFTKDDIGTHNYIITEVKGSAEGFEYSTDVYNVTILVGEDDNGDLYRNISMDGSPSTLATFTNVYNGPDPEAVKLPLTIIKEVVGGGNKVGPEQFEFTIENLTEGTSRKVRTNTEGVFTDYLEFDADDAGKTIEYRIKEVKGGRSDIVYDQSVYNVSVKVENVGGVLKTTVSVNGFASSGNLSFTFRNVYKGTPVVPPSEEAVIVPIIINKTVISGGDKEMGPADFEFVLEHVENGSEDNYCEYGRTGVDGKTTFKLVFDKEDIGKTFKYKVYETDEGLDGVKYDKTVYDIELTVYRDDLGEIAARGNVKGGEGTEQINTGVTGIFGKEKETEEVPSMNIVLKFVNEYDVSDEGNPETGLYMIAEGIAAMLVSGFMFVLLVLTDKRFKFKS